MTHAASRSSISARESSSVVDASSGIVVRMRIADIVNPCTSDSNRVLCVRVRKRDLKRRPPAPKRPARSSRVVRWLVLFVASLIIVDGLFGERGLLAMLRARQEHEQLAAALAQQRAENARLREEVRRLNEDPRAIEEAARRELGLIRPGEKVFIIKDVPPAKP